jgi:hypothetical protein
MPRIRSIKPDAFHSDSLSTVSILARWTFAGLWTYCDDEGRGRADARLIKAALFPIDDTTTLSDVLGALNELESIGAICRYRVEDKTYLHVPKWEEHQKINRPTESKLPACPACAGGPNDSSVNTHGAITEPSLSPPDRKGTGKGKEQGSEHAHERVSAPDRFAEFWAAYPRKTDKAKSRKAWDKAAKKKDPDFLIAAAGLYANAKRGTEQRFILHPSTWLNGERWEDEDRPAVLAVVNDPSELPPVQDSWMKRRPS